jgi:acyl carrier protein phosphodiesterase
MIGYNWLMSYQTVEGISKILTQMDSRTKNESKMRFSSNELTEFYTDFEKEFTTFFEDLKIQSHQKLIIL